MKNRTLKELVALAKARGLKGYSKLSKAELLRRLAAETPNATLTQPMRRKRAPSVAKRTTAPAKTTRQGKESAKTKRAATPTSAAATRPATTEQAVAAPVRPTINPAASTEELVETAKYALDPSGRAAVASVTDLGEDIDRLPPLSEPLVCLLPQKPGILYAYWSLPSDAMQRSDYKLRLVRAGNEALELQEEVPVQGQRGGWYFHISESASNAGMAVQLGYYENGRFIAARGRNLARLPSVHASARTDERWWINEADFMQMYVRAGGMVTPTRRYRWIAAIGSSAGGSSAPGQQLAWPGGVSSSSQ